MLLLSIVCLWKQSTYLFCLYLSCTPYETNKRTFYSKTNRKKAQRAQIFFLLLYGSVHFLTMYMHCMVIISMSQNELGFLIDCMSIYECIWRLINIYLWKRQCVQFSYCYLPFFSTTYRLRIRNWCEIVEYIQIMGYVLFTNGQIVWNKKKLL